MRIKTQCPNCEDFLEIELNDKFEIILVKHMESKFLEISSEELRDKTGIEFG